MTFGGTLVFLLRPSIISDMMLASHRAQVIFSSLGALVYLSEKPKRRLPM
jgi:hypothetical protein